MKLPVDEVLPALNAQLAANQNAVLVAEPGAGKTTKVPLSCLQADWLSSKKIIMLEPRRLAARSAVSYMAGVIGEKVGETVGFRVRGESRVSPQTRLEVVTEGILTRIIQAQPELENIGLIIFDEFHERSLNADLALALCLEVQRSIRPDLRILLMSATLDAEAVAEMVGAKEIIRSSGRNFPVETRYLSHKPELALDRLVSDCIRRALRECEGDILVFLPGRSEIYRVLERLQEKPLAVSATVVTLYSDMKSSQQDLVLRQRNPEIRKIILATSIAETSLTIDGVRVVIDCGLMRVPRFDPRRAMSSLETITVSKASADQRRGRAGRQAPGICYRLWTEYQQQELQSFNEAEILHADLAPLALELSMWGQGDFKQFSFITEPPAKSYQQGQSLLRDLSAIDHDGKITDHGRNMISMGVHPRIAHMLINAQKFDAIEIACDLAALLEEKNVLGDRSVDLEISSRWHALDRYRKSNGSEKDHKKSALSRTLKESERLRSLCKQIDSGKSFKIENCNRGMIAVLTAMAYPDRIAKRREPKGVSYLMRNGAGVSLPDPNLLSRFEYLAVAQIGGSSTQKRIHLCEPIEETDLRSYFKKEIITSSEVFWDARDNSVKSREREHLGALTLIERPKALSKDEHIPALLEGIRLMGLDCLPWNAEIRSLVARNQWLKSVDLVSDPWPDLSPETLLASMETWLAPFLSNITSKTQLDKLDLKNALNNLFSWQQNKQLDTLAPAYFELPTGTKVMIDYIGANRPVVSVRLQEILGQSSNPVIGGGRYAVAVELLSPARRPLQITKDLQGFWSTSYHQVRKEMQGRYPKHLWPIDPANAKPTRRIKNSS